jgi:hypothetical protein
MGAKHGLANSMKAASKSKDDQSRKIEANLRILQTMAQGKLDNFFSELKLGEDKLKFRIGKVLTEYSEIFVMETSDAEPLKKGVDGVINSIVGGGIAGTVKKVVKLGIDAMIASGSGTIAEKRLYTIRLQGIGLQRIDIYLFQYDISVSGLVAGKESVFAYAYAISLLSEYITRSELAAIIAASFGVEHKPTGQDDKDEYDSEDDVKIEKSSDNQFLSIADEKELIKLQMELYNLLEPIIGSQNKVYEKDDLTLEI